MIKPQITPTPWVIDSRSHVEGGRGAVVAEVPTSFGTITIRSLDTIGFACPSVQVMDERGAANAQLMIAAPDLLVACQAFVRDRTTCSTVNGKDLEAWELMCAAIAKATGAIEEVGNE